MTEEREQMREDGKRERGVKTNDRLGKESERGGGRGERKQMRGWEKRETGGERERKQMRVVGRRQREGGWERREERIGENEIFYKLDICLQ